MLTRKHQWLPFEEDFNAASTKRIPRTPASAHQELDELKREACGSITFSSTSLLSTTLLNPKEKQPWAGD